MDEYILEIDYEIENGYIMEAEPRDGKPRKSPIYGWLKTLDNCLKVVFPINWVDKVWKIIDYFSNKPNPSI